MDPLSSPRADHGAVPVVGHVAADRDFLTFRLGEEEYGVDILRVQEIRSYERPTRIAGAPAGLLGVVNLRGTVVPVVDLRLQFGRHDGGRDASAVVIVLTLGDRVAGMVVDSVSDVVTPAAHELRDVPQFSAGVDTDRLLGIATLQQRMLLLLDIDRLLAGSGVGLVPGQLQ